MTFKKVPFGDIKAFNVIVEAPAGSRKKYEYDPKIEAITLDKVFYDDLAFPFNYGHVAKTMAHDDYPLDAFVFSTYPLHTGVVVACRAIGMLEMIDEGKKDHKIFAVPISEGKLANLQNITDLKKEDTEKLLDFYKRVTEVLKKDIKILGFADKEEAQKELLRTLEFDKE